MKIVILGAGLIGISTAYFLKKYGHDVVVIDRQPQSGLETSFANGGQISVCYSEPWSSFSNLKKMISWIGKEDSPILFKPQLNKHQLLWALQFLYECFPHRNNQNIRDMLKIALFSRKTLAELRKELNLEYHQSTNGILTFYTSESSYQHGIEAAKFMSKFGCERIMKNTEETLSIEPTLNNCSLKIYGADYSPEDESGDAFIYTQKMADICAKMGVEFIYHHEIKHIETYNDMVRAVIVHDLNQDIEKRIHADSYVLSLGSYSYLLARSIGVYLPIYPAKGYSATVPIIDQDLANNVSLTDMDSKTVYTRLGNTIRLAGTAEFNGYDLNLNKTRCDALIKRFKKIYPEGLDYNNAEFWTGLRPATPGNVPIIEKNSKYSNLYINSGHGTLGWTMAAGSGKLISQIINNQKLFDQ